MRLRAWLWLAFNSCLLAAVRPHYGGSVTVGLSTAPTILVADGAGNGLSVPIAETLIRIGSRGEIQPGLAVAWQHDDDFRRWRFSIRSKVIFHDGEPLTAATAVPSLLSALNRRYGDVSIEAGGQAIVVQSGHAMPDLLEELALPGAAVFRSSENNPLIGTGPFRITVWEPRRRLTVAAFEDYWGGRPYLDSVAFELGSSQAHADVFDIPAGPSHRMLPEGIPTWSSEPRTLIAIRADNAEPVLLQSLALVIDRAPIVNVLAQRKGEAAFGLLPQWLSGYAFLFQSTLDVVRAKQLMSQVRQAPVTLSYPPNDVFLRSVAERIALNARDAGITIQPTANANGNLRFVEWPLESKDAAAELATITDHLGSPDRASQIDRSKPESLYELERSLLEQHRILPLIYLRETYGIAPRVHFQPTSSETFSLHLENAWVEP